MVSFYTCLFTFIHGRTLLMTHLIMPIDNIITQTIFVVLFTSRSLLTWEKPLDASSSVSPRYSSTTYSQLTTSPFFYRYYMMTDFAFSHKGLTGGGRSLPHYGGALPSAPTAAIPHIIYNPIGACLPYWPQGLGGRNKESVMILPSC